MELKEVDETKELLRKLGEEELIRSIDSFLTLNEGLETKRGREFIEVSVLSFLEGLLLILKNRYQSEIELHELYEKIRERRSELDKTFRKPRPPIFEE